MDKATLRGLVLAIGRDPNPDPSRDLSREEDGATITGSAPKPTVVKTADEHLQQ